MQRVQGFDGFFFRAKDPEGLAKWYEDHLGINPAPKNMKMPPWVTESGVTVFGPFAADTDYFVADKTFMRNFRVADLDKKYFSLKTGTAMEASNLPLRKWAYAIYLEITSLKGVSSMKLHRDLKISQSAAWFMKHRIREGLAAETERVFSGPVEADECFIGGLERNKAKHKRIPGRGPSSKQPVVGIKDRDTNAVAARVVDRLDAETLQGFVDEHAVPGAQLYTDDTSA